MVKFKKCEDCNVYTLEDICQNCKKKLPEFKTIKFSLEDPYFEYRIKQKKQELVENISQRS
jgi:rRNA maturation protein Nop10